jgi:hypothetical protein
LLQKNRQLRSEWEESDKKFRRFNPSFQKQETQTSIEPYQRLRSKSKEKDKEDSYSRGYGNYMGRSPLDNDLNDRTSLHYKY